MTLSVEFFKFVTLGSVMQNSQRRAGEESKLLSSEDASKINDGLYCYEQVPVFVSTSYLMENNFLI